MIVLAIAAVAAAYAVGSIGLMTAVLTARGDNHGERRAR